MKRILVVDDHAIVRSGIRRLLAPLDGIAIEDAPNGEEAMALAGRAAFDLVILDLNLPGIGGMELLRRLLKLAPQMSVVVFSMLTEPVYVGRAMETGALGYVSKNAAPEELLKAVRAALAGQSYIERELADELGGESRLRPLTNRDLEIMRLLAQGRTLMQIAQTLGVAYKTVANTCGNIKDKLGLASTADLIRVSIERSGG